MRPLALALAAAVGLAASALALAHDHVSDSPKTAAAAPAKKDIVGTAVEAGSFKTLVAAVKAAGLVEALQAEGPLTVFAPTDAAFAKLPEGTVEALLKPENKATLQRILTYHVVSGRVLAKDLLPVASARTLAGDSVPMGLTIGGANVTATDVLCSNGVIHVIDSVLIPPAKESSESKEVGMEVGRVLMEAIDRGVPVYNDGHPDRCARIYREAARAALQMKALGELHRAELTAALTAPAKDASTEAWTLRGAFDEILADLSFEPHSEAPLPEGFPGAGPVGRVIEKEYPRYRAARASGGGAFWQLFDHIKKNEVAMTAPVEMTLDDRARETAMAFLYERPAQGESGKQGAVKVLDLEPVRVLSIGIRGRRTKADMANAKRAIEARLAAMDGVRRAGPWRTMGYNSPMVPGERQFWELQLPIESASEGHGTARD